MPRASDEVEQLPGLADPLGDGGVGVPGGVHDESMLDARFGQPVDVTADLVDRAPGVVLARDDEQRRPDPMRIGEG